MNVLWSLYNMPDINSVTCAGGSVLESPVDAFAADGIEATAEARGRTWRRREERDSIVRPKGVLSGRAARH